MSSRYVVFPKADSDIDGIADALLERAGHEAGLRFLDSVLETFALVASRPRMGWQCRLPHENLRRTRVFRIAAPFQKYLVFYNPRRDGIEILRVLHGAQDLEERLFGEDAG